MHLCPAPYPIVQLYDHIGVNLSAFTQFLPAYDHVMRAKDLLSHLSEQIAACNQFALSHAFPSSVRAMVHQAAAGPSFTSTAASISESRRAALFSDASALVGLGGGGAPGLGLGIGLESDTFALSLMDGPSSSLAYNGQLRLLTAAGSGGPGAGALPVPVSPLVSPALAPMRELFHLLNSPHIRVRFFTVL